MAIRIRHANENAVAPQQADIAQLTLQAETLFQVILYGTRSPVSGFTRINLYSISRTWR